MGDRILQVNSISKGFHCGQKNYPLLTQLNLTVTKSERVLLMGRSGSGKTTLIQILGTLQAPDSGEILIIDQSINQMSEAALNHFRSKQLGFMFQQHHFITGLSVIENVVLPLQLQVKHQRHDSYQKALELLQLLDIQKPLHQKIPSQLSMGEQARVSIARALIHGPKLLLMDEPSASLDDQLTQEVFGYIATLQKQLGFAMIVATHDDSLKRYADTVYNLKNGYLEKMDVRA